MEIEKVKTVEEEFGAPVVKYTNTWGMTDAQLARRKIEVAELEKHYPNLPSNWIEAMWSYCEVTPKEEQDRIIKNNLWAGKPDEKWLNGGVCKNAITISDE